MTTKLGVVNEKLVVVSDLRKSVTLQETALGWGRLCEKMPYKTPVKSALQSCHALHSEVTGPHLEAFRDSLDLFVPFDKMKEQLVVLDDLCEVLTLLHSRLRLVKLELKLDTPGRPATAKDQKSLAKLKAEDEHCCEAFVRFGNAMQPAVLTCRLEEVGKFALGAQNSGGVAETESPGLPPDSQPPPLLHAGTQVFNCVNTSLLF